MAYIVLTYIILYYIILYYYSGCVGGNNLDDIDNQHVNFTPYTVKRVNIPREAETSQ